MPSVRTWSALLGGGLCGCSYDIVAAPRPGAVDLTAGAAYRPGRALAGRVDMPGTPRFLDTACHPRFALRGRRLALRPGRQPMSENPGGTPPRDDEPARGTDPVEPPAA